METGLVETGRERRGALAAKEHRGFLGLPRSRGGGKKDPPREPSDGVQPCHHLDVLFLASRTERCDSCCFMPQVCGPSLQWAQDTSADCNRPHGLGQVPPSAGPRFAHLCSRTLLNSSLLSRCVLGISSAAGIGYTAGSPVPGELTSQRNIINMEISEISSTLGHDRPPPWPGLQGLTLSPVSRRITTPRLGTSSGQINSREGGCRDPCGQSWMGSGEAEQGRVRVPQTSPCGEKLGWQRCLLRFLTRHVSPPQGLSPLWGHGDTETGGHLELIRMALIPLGDVLTGPLHGISRTLPVFIFQ